MTNNILIVGPAWVGDMVMSQTLFAFLKMLDPDCVIDVIAPAWTHALLARMPEVRHAWHMDIGHGQLQLAKRRRIGLNLRQQHYQKAIIIPNSFKSALVPWWAKIPQRTGWRREGRQLIVNDSRKSHKKHYPLMIQRLAALALPKDASLPKALPYPSLQVQSQAQAQAIEQLQLNTDRPILALCPGAEFGPSKRWPERYYAAIANAQLKAGWQVWLFGSKNDQGQTQKIQALTGSRCHDLAGATTLAQAVDLLALAKGVVTNDSGLMHIAAALGQPLVALFGSSSPDFTPPLSDKAQILRLGLDCSPCFARDCPLKHHDCLEKLFPEQVLTAMEAFK